MIGFICLIIVVSQCPYGLWGLFHEVRVQYHYSI